MKDLSFFERIRELGRMTPSEARIAEHMEKVYPMIALETITTICECADVGRATVVRFIQKLGYDSFSTFNAICVLKFSNACSQFQDTRT